VPGFGVTYICRVTIRVGDVARDGCGAGHGIDRDAGQAHESALKEAETDAMKRALMTFGNPFGLALYDKGWTDAKVASDLGVPLQWVRVIRDENFGDEVGNEDIRKQLAEAKEALALVRQLEPDIKKLLALADRIERSVAECSKVLK
jgi:hypothetical protein